MIEDATPEMSLRSRWMKELEAEDKAHEKYRKRAAKVVARYRDEGPNGDRENGHKFNVFWSNIEVLTPATYSAEPKPEIRRRFLDKNPVAREVSEMLERALTYTIDTYDFEGTMGSVVNNLLVPGLAQVRLRYTPYFEMGQPPQIPMEVEQYVDPVTEEYGERYSSEGVERLPEGFDEGGQPFTLGEPEEEKVYEEVSCEPVQWKNFRWQPADRWEDCRWAGIDHFLTKEELKEQFGDKGCECSLTHYSEGKDEKGDDKDRAKVTEIFDKEKRKVIVVSEGYKEGLLSEEDDPLNLEGFYPFPKPLMATVTDGKYVPIPDFVFYQDQADELDIISDRIAELMKMLKVRGIYDGSFGELVNVLNSDDGQLTPVSDFAERFQGKGDLSSVLSFMPLKEIASVVVGLHERRDALKQEIYEITGIADIMRGASNASETLGAQEMKRQFGSMRIGAKQKKIAFFVRDIFRLKAEIIAEHFDDDTLELMTGVQITPEMREMMQNDLLRGFSINVETDTTVAQDASTEQQNRIEVLTGITNFIEKVAPLVQVGVMPMDMAKELLLFSLRSFKTGRQLEDMIEKMGGEDEDPRITQMQQQLQQLQGENQQLKQQTDSKAMEFEDHEADRENDRVIKGMEIMSQMQ